MVRQWGEVEIYEGESAVLVVNEFVNNDLFDILPFIVVFGHQLLFLLLVEIGVEEL